MDAVHVVGAGGIGIAVGYALRANGLLAAGAAGKEVVKDSAAITLVSLIYFAVVGLTVAWAGGGSPPSGGGHWCTSARSATGFTCITGSYLNSWTPS